MLSPQVSGVLTGSATVMKGDTARLTISLTGTPPWWITLGSIYGNINFYAQSSPYIYQFKADTTISFRLNSVANNECGVGAASGVAKITGLEPMLPVQVRAFPNPTAGWLHLEGTTLLSKTIAVQLTDASGRAVMTRTLFTTEGKLNEDLDVSPYAPGVYILTVSEEGRKAVFRVVRQ